MQSVGKMRRRPSSTLRPIDRESPLIGSPKAKRQTSRTIILNFFGIEESLVLANWRPPRDTSISPRELTTFSVPQQLNRGSVTGHVWEFNWVGGAIPRSCGQQMIGPQLTWEYLQWNSAFFFYIYIYINVHTHIWLEDIRCSISLSILTSEI